LSNPTVEQAAEHGVSTAPLQSRRQQLQPKGKDVALCSPSAVANLDRLATPSPHHHSFSLTPGFTSHFPLFSPVLLVKYGQ
jgi:hypothetical protein